VHAAGWLWNVAAVCDQELIFTYSVCSPDAVVLVVQCKT
jgi:hypothetical protein